MMRISAAKLATSAFVLLGVAFGALPARAQIARGGLATVAPATSMVEQVQYRHYHGGYYGHGGGGGAGAAIGAGILGLAAGAIIAGSAANAAPPPPQADPNWVAYCARKYRSFDPASGTYLSNDGNRYVCQ
jgi:hypothetical protein